MNNLIQVIIAGNASDTINLAIKEREQRKIKLTSESAALTKSQNKVQPVSEEVVLAKMQSVQEAILANPLQCYPILRTMFKKKVRMIPVEDSGGGRGSYAAAGSIFCNGVLEEVFDRKFTGNKKGAANGSSRLMVGK